MKYPKATTYMLCLTLIQLSTSGFAQNLKQDRMKELSFLVGEWVGTTKVFENGVVVKEGSAYEKISYDLDGHILVIQLNTEFLQLRTLIRYDERDQKYYYHRFSKEGAAIYPAAFRDGQLVVWKDEKTRFFFGQTSAGDFREYGEKLMDGKWVKYFEDTFTNTD